MGTQTAYIEALKFLSPFIILYIGFQVKSIESRKERDKVVDLSLMKNETALEIVKTQCEDRFSEHKNRIEHLERRIDNFSK